MMNITLFTNNCPKCEVLKQKLEDKGLNFEICIDKKEMMKLGMMSMPQLKIDDEIMIFSQAIQWVNKQ